LIQYKYEDGANMNSSRLYIAGVVAGFGAGLLVGTWLSWGWHPWIVIPGSFMIAIGGVAARVARKNQRDPQPRFTELGATRSESR
jgi:hypothetical protein